MWHRFLCNRIALYMLFAAILLGGFLFLHTTLASTIYFSNSFSSLASTTVYRGSSGDNYFVLGQAASGTSGQTIYLTIGAPDSSVSGFGANLGVYAGTPSLSHYYTEGFSGGAYVLPSVSVTPTNGYYLKTYAFNGYNGYPSWSAGNYILFNSDGGWNGNDYIDPNSSVVNDIEDGNGTDYSLPPYVCVSNDPNPLICNENVQSYYAQLQSGTNHLFQDENTSTILKTLPADWIIHVESSTDASGDPMISGGYHWFKVSDPTDGTMGWMTASSSDGQYISSYDGSAQAGLEASSTAIADKTARVNTLIAAMDHYYTNNSTSSSLYSSDDINPDNVFGLGLHISDEFNSSSPSTTFPESLAFGIAAAESGQNDATLGTNNGIVGADISGREYGHGLMQLTVKYQPEDIKYLQRVLNSDPDTVVNTSTNPMTWDGSMGHETGAFGSLTENAVERFQTKYSLTDPMGVVGTSTLAELNSILSGTPTSSITALIPSGWSFNMEQDHPYVEMATEAVANANPTEYILHDEGEQGGFDKRGFGNGLDVPPCDNLDNPATSTFFENCYFNSSPNGYATNTAYGQTFAYYGNTPQSVFANVKGGLNLLVNTYYPTSTPTEPLWDPYTGTTTTFSGIERSWFTDMYHYNGRVHYLEEVAARMDTFVDYKVGGVQLIPTSTETVQLAGDLRVASSNYTEFLLLSPGDLQIVDSSGRTTGMVNGKIQENIPGSAYNPETNSAVVLMTDDPFTYKVTGTEDNDYGMEIISVRNGKKVIFNNPAIPIQKGEIHSYTLDFNKLLVGQKGVMMDIDTKGNGTIDKVETFGPSATDIAGEDLPITSVNPDILNAKILSPEIGTPIPKPLSHPYVPPISIPVYPTSTPSSTFLISTSSLSFDSTTIETFPTSSTTSTMINLSTSNL
jgi:hypothetical protein